MKPECVLFRPEYVDRLGGDHLAALMLAQIVYWCSPSKEGKTKLRVFKRGQFWLVKSHVDWQNELRLTRRQSQRCLEVLKKAGLIKTELYRFGGHATVHLQLIADPEQLLLQPDAPLGAGIDAPVGATNVHPQVQLLTETTTETTTESTYALASLAPEKQKEVSENFQEEEKFNHDDFLKGSAKNLAVVPQNMQAVSATWKEEVGALNKGSSIKYLTGKEIGQLKNVHKQVPARSVELVKYAVRNWYKFVSEVQAKKGVSGGLDPNTGFFCAHFEIALQLIAQPVKTIAPPQVVIIQKPKPVEVTDLATYEDVQETLAAIAAIHKKASIAKIATEQPFGV